MRLLLVLSLVVVLGALALWLAPAERSARRGEIAPEIRAPPDAPPSARALAPPSAPGRENLVPPAPEDDAELEATLVEHAPPAREPVVHGIVLGDGNAPLAGALVGIDVRQAGMEPILKARTGRDGRFQFPPLPDGPHRLEIRAPGYGRAECVVELPADALRELRIGLNRPGVVRGVVRDPQGHAVPGARIFLHDERNAIVGRIATGPREIESALTRADGASEWPQDGTPRERSDARGRFEIPVDAETVRLQAAAPGFAPSVPLTLTLLSGEQRDEVVLVLRPGCTLRGQTLAADGLPLAAPLVYRAEDGSRFEFDSTADGRFEVRALPPGNGTLSCGRSRIPPLQGSLATRLSVQRDEEVVLNLTPLE